MDTFTKVTYQFFRLLVQIYELPARLFLDRDVIGACIAWMWMLIVITILIRIGFILGRRATLRSIKKRDEAAASATQQRRVQPAN